MGKFEFMLLTMYSNVLSAQEMLGVGETIAHYDEPKRHTTDPTVTGTSVIGVKFSGGVMIAADTLGSYGSCARFRNCSRLMKVNESTILGASGDYADFQFMKNIIEENEREEQINDGVIYNPRRLHSWLTRVMYNRRTKFNPLWNVFLVAGVHNDEPFLGYVDKLGVAFESNTMATGYGHYMAQPLMREAYEKNSEMSEEEAMTLIDTCMKILYYRDARSYNKYEIAVVTRDGAKILPARSSQTNWDSAYRVRGFDGSQ